MILYEILERVKNTWPAQLPAPMETRQFVDHLTTMVVANSEDDVVDTICSVALMLRDDLEKKKNSPSAKSKSKIVSNRNVLATRVHIIFKVNDYHLPVADAARVGH